MGNAASLFCLTRIFFKKSPARSGTKPHFFRYIVKSCPLEEKNIRQRLKQYLLGNAGEEDINAVDNWYASFDSGAPASLSEDEAAVTRQEIWDRVAPVLKEEKKVWRLTWQWKAAAAIIIIAGAAAILLRLTHNRTGEGNAMAYTTVKTGIGERKEIILRDSSRLTLDAGTTIKVGDDFSKSRKIELVDGEVFFDIKSDARRPFIIQSGELTTTVLGTAFTISAYKDLHNVSIGVVSGKVQVASKTAALSILEKDEELVYSKHDRTYKRIALDESLTAWREGRLLLNDLSFGEMNTIIRKNFGIDIITADDAIKNTRYTTELLAAMSPTEAAEVLAAIHHLKIRLKDNKFLLYKPKP